MTVIVGLLPALLETTIASTIAVLVVLALRRWLRMLFGATIAYAAWSLVPVAVVAVLLPAATRPVMAMPMVQVLVAQPLAMSVPDGATAIGLRTWMGLAWLLGAVLAAWMFARQQRGFRRGLGILHPCADGLQQANGIAGLPAAIGLWKPAIVLPADFDTRYSSEQRALMLAHERMHIACGDLYANALAAALRCLFWFNPLLHLATRHFRHDQELACDQRVVARHPNARRAYGEAMFKTQLALHPLPLGCHWGSHPLKERIAMLKQPAPTLSRWIAGTSLVGALVFGMGFAAWSAQPARAAVSHDVPPPAPPAPPTPPAPSVGPVPPAPPAPPALPPPLPVPAIPAVKPIAPAIALRAPGYPKEALAQKISGKVVLVIDVDAKGNPANVTVAESEPAGVFDAAAIAAAKEWKFNPEMQKGKPAAGRIRVPVRFEADPVKDGPMRVGPKTSPDPSAYDWIQYDPAVDDGVNVRTCDVIRMGPGAGIGYCGRLKNPARRR